MLRQILYIGAATAGMIGAANAQGGGQSRDDLLDALTRHIQICSEISDTQQRLSCYDRLQTQVGSAAPAAARPTPTPTPLQPNPMQATQAPTPQTPSYGQPTPLAPPPTSGSSISSAPLSPQPLTVPGGGVATLGSSSPSISGGSSSAQDPDAAFDPRRQVSRPAETMGPKPQPLVRRTGPRPIPYSSAPQPLVTLGANNLTYGDSRYWQVTVTLTSTTPRPMTTQAQCTFLNGGRVVSSDNIGPVTIQPGEQITTELIGPPTTTYVDSTNCRVISP
jgi:hypothetical protein